MWCYRGQFSANSTFSSGRWPTMDWELLITKDLFSSSRFKGEVRNDGEDTKVKILFLIKRSLRPSQVCSHINPDLVNVLFGAYVSPS